MSYDDPFQKPISLSQPKSWFSGTYGQLMGFSSILAAFSSQSYALDSIKLFALGSIIETGRRFCKWLFERFKFRYSITARFAEGDPAYEWIILFLTQENVWRRSRDFYVNSKTSARKWGIKVDSDSTSGREEGAEYIPIYEIPQLFRWNGFWLEIWREQGTPQMHGRNMVYSSSILYLTIYSLNMSVLSTLVDEAKRRYIEVSRPNVIIHSSDLRHAGPNFSWNKVKSKVRRPLSSIILQEGVLESLVQDAQEFIDSEDWYIEAGIPYRRGYLLYGPPGTGKSSTIYALAGELNLEIYALSLSSDYIDDTLLQAAASLIPKRGILLIEDIDCAFPSREDEEESQLYPDNMFGVPHMPPPKKSAVTLSGLLNIIDGVESEEGKFFIATTNYIDRLDPALLRPGRIDRKVQYSLATKHQAHSLFTRFFPDSRFGLHTDKSMNEKSVLNLLELAEKFADGIPEDDFSVAEIQGYLLSCKKNPVEATEGVRTWVEQEHKERAAREEREKQRKQKLKEVKEKREANSHLRMPLSQYSAYGQPIVSGPPVLPELALPHIDGVKITEQQLTTEAATSEEVVTEPAVEKVVVNGVAKDEEPESVLASPE